MKARWMVTNRDSGGMVLTYHNLIDDIIMDCGATYGSLQQFLDFALAEGACDGDGFYVNGMLMCILGESNDKRYLSN